MEDDRERKEEKKEEKNNDGSNEPNEENVESEESDEDVFNNLSNFMNTDEDTAARNAFLQQLFATMVLGRNNPPSSNTELIAHLKTSEVLHCPRVESAFSRIPRHLFVPQRLQSEAYLDSPLRLSSFGFNISAPHMYVLCLQNLKLQPGNSFLDIGSGCGHFTALAADLVGPTGSVLGIDLLPEYIDFAKQNIAKYEEHGKVKCTNIRFKVKNSFLLEFSTKPKNKRFDRIHVGACCPTRRLPDLIKLLNVNGILVTPLKDKLVKITKLDEEGKYKEDKLMDVRYGDLKIPSDAEIREAKWKSERKRMEIVDIPEDKKEEIAEEEEEDKKDFIEIELDGKKFVVDKSDLIENSEFFRKMISSGLKESNSHKVQLQDHKLDCFEICLQFIDEKNKNSFSVVDIISEKEKGDTLLLDVFEEANKLGMEKLKLICEKELASVIDIDNAADLYQAACYFNGEQLKKVCTSFLVKNFEDVSKTKGFEDMHRQFLVELTREVCRWINNINTK